MTPEQKARQLIDQRLAQAGWDMQDYAAMNIGAARGVAVREFPLTTGFADYVLYADASVIGVVEAKKRDQLSSASRLNPRSTQPG
jgi:type I restriction enzyme R subunit